MQFSRFQITARNHCGNSKFSLIICWRTLAKGIFVNYMSTFFVCVDAKLICISFYIRIGAYLLRIFWHSWTASFQSSDSIFGHWPKFDFSARCFGNIHHDFAYRKIVRCCQVVCPKSPIANHDEIESGALADLDSIQLPTSWYYLVGIEDQNTFLIPWS